MGRIQTRSPAFNASQRSQVEEVLFMIPTVEKQMLHFTLTLSREEKETRLYDAATGKRITTCQVFRFINEKIQSNLIPKTFNLEFRSANTESVH